MPYKICPRCRKVIPQGRTYCETCAPIAEAQIREAKEHKDLMRRKQYNREYNKQRDPKYLAFYRSKDWKVTSRAKLQACQYRCELNLEGCTRLAVEVDHILPIQTPEGWERRLDWENLEGVCTSCHNLKHNRFRGRSDDGVIDLRSVER